MMCPAPSSQLPQWPPWLLLTIISFAPTAIMIAAASVVYGQALDGLGESFDG